MIIKMIMILHHIFFEYFSSPPSLCSFLPFSLYFYFPLLFSSLFFYFSLLSSPLLFFSLLLFSSILFSSRLLYFLSFLHSQYVSPSINPSSQTNFSTILKSHLPFFFFFLILSSAPQCLNNNSGDVPKL